MIEHYTSSANFNAFLTKNMSKLAFRLTVRIADLLPVEVFTTIVVKGNRRLTTRPLPFDGVSFRG